jgi:arylsulfatase A-like enzyme
VDTPPDYQGVSLLEPRARAALFFTDYSLPFVGLRDGRWKLIAELGTTHARLFDLETDPQETRNVASLHAARVEAGRRQLEAWAAAQKALVLRRDLAGRR